MHNLHNRILLNRWKKIASNIWIVVFNDKLCIKSFFYEYLSMYIIIYPPSTPKKRGWGYTYAPIIEKHCWSKVQRGMH